MMFSLSLVSLFGGRFSTPPSVAPSLRLGAPMWRPGRGCGEIDWIKQQKYKVWDKSAILDMDFASDLFRRLLYSYNFTLCGKSASKSNIFGVPS